MIVGPQWNLVRMRYLKIENKTRWSDSWDGRRAVLMWDGLPGLPSLARGVWKELGHILLDLRTRQRWRCLGWLEFIVILRGDFQRVIVRCVLYHGAPNLGGRAVVGFCGRVGSLLGHRWRPVRGSLLVVSGKDRVVVGFLC